MFQDFEPFWEFIAGPIHAGTWRPEPLDNTFGPRAMFQKGCSADQPDDLAPCFGLQFFGRVTIDGAQRDDDRDPQGRRRPGPLVDRHRAADGAMVARCPSHAQLGRTT